MADYGTKKSVALAYLTDGESSSTSASDSDVKKPKKSFGPNPRAYRLWAFEVKEEMSVHGAIENLGEEYTSGKISRFEFENRTALIEHFSKLKPPEDLPFIMESGELPEGSDDEEASLGYRLAARGLRSAAKATHFFCYVCTSCFTECYRRL